MNISSLIALIIIIFFFTVAARYLYKNGTCGSCPDHGSCSGHCSSDAKREMKKRMKEDPEYKGKMDMIDEIIRKRNS